MSILKALPLLFYYIVNRFLDHRIRQPIISAFFCGRDTNGFYLFVLSGKPLISILLQQKVNIQGCSLIDVIKTYVC
jgi:hypothetical protein